jgi:beta-lactamase superfamily II metal-dependent hydrolase
MKWIAFGLVLLLIFGCTQPAGNGGAGNGQPETGNQTSGGHLVIGEGEGTVVSEGSAGETVPVVEYTETPNSDMYVYFFNVGYGDEQGDAILIKKGDVDILVDAGPVEKRQDLVTMLLEAGVDDFELVVSTHDNPAETGGFEYVSNRFKFGEVWRPEEGGENYTSYLNSLGAESVRTVGVGDRKQINGINITVLNPIRGEGRFFDINNDGVVLKIEDRGMCVLLTGDILGSQQTVAQLSGPCQIVQWPNHGIGAGLTEINYFIDNTEPEVIVISGSATDWTDSRQSLISAAHLGEIRDIPVLENYNGKSVKIVWDGTEYTAVVER